ncbi:hypothetical protein, partial [Streptomyces lavendulae]|uniref:hypothetical protein n=1 Tax=Streptomyces lavendulae TaxID=1914 RepID=UPI0031E97DF5
METLLQPPSVHNRVMVNWAWHAYTAMHAPPHKRELWKATAARAGTRTGDAEKAELVERIQLHLEQIVGWPSTEQLPSDVFAAEVLKQLRADYPAEAADSILSTFGFYLEYLADSARDPLRDLCEAAIQASVASYRHHKIAVPPDVRGLKVNVIVGWLQEAPQATFPNSFLGLACVEAGCRESCCKDVAPDLRPHVQTLRLKLAPGRFDADTLASLPFVLFHECVSHVLQAPWDPARRAPDLSSQFAEGWMDKAALRVFEDALHARPPCSQVALIPYRHRINVFQDAGIQLYRDRHNDKGVAFAHSLAAASRKSGVDAAELLIETFWRLSVPDPLDVLSGQVGDAAGGCLALDA